MSGYASLREVREVVVGTLEKEGRNPKDYNITAIMKEGFPPRSGGGYGWPVPEEWYRLVDKHHKPLSLTAFKRMVRVGQKVTVVNHLHPHISGTRTVHKVQTRNLATMPEGGERPWWTDWPKPSLCRIEGSTLHFLNDARPDEIAFSYTFDFGNT